MSTPETGQRIFVLARSSLHDDLAAFYIDREAHGLSKRTVAWYREKLGILARFMAGMGLDDVCAISPTLIRQYLLELSKTHNPGGVHACYRTLRAFLRWWGEELAPQGWANPIAKVKAPKLPQEVLSPVDLDHLRRMLATCEGRAIVDLRDRAVLLSLLDSGARASEFTGLTLADLDVTTGALTIRHGKGNKARVTFLGAKSR